MNQFFLNSFTRKIMTDVHDTNKASCFEMVEKMINL